MQASSWPRQAAAGASLARLLALGSWLTLPVPQFAQIEMLGRGI